MKKIILSVIVAGLAVGIVLLYLGRPIPVYPSAMPAHTPDAKNGAVLFTAGGCLSCHKPAEDNKTADKSLPSGGAALKTPIGTFYPPNLTPDNKTGIGKWKTWEFVSAMKNGVSPDMRHYLPAFPYTSYAAMTVPDIIDIHAYLKTLKPVASPSRSADIPVAWLLRLGVGVWKLMAMGDGTYQEDSSQSATWNRGAYLVNGPGHCGECHTPRNFMMIWQMDKYMAGGPHPEGGKDKVPSLRGLIERKKYKDAKDLVSAFQFGEAFGYEDMSSGGMGSVQTNLSKLPESDLQAIAVYLTSLK
ncbi:MAG: cytochrome c [Rhizobiales bacterium]|nr:cytochrome c [Hyphomicrobiales bacterium]